MGERKWRGGKGKRVELHRIHFLFFHQLFSSKVSVYFFSTTRFTFSQDVFLGRSESYLLKEINYRILNVERETNHGFLLCFFSFLEKGVYWAYWALQSCSC